MIENEILACTNNGINVHQLETACLAADSLLAVEDRSRQYPNRQNLSIEQKRQIRTNNTKIIDKSIITNSCIQYKKGMTFTSIWGDSISLAEIYLNSLGIYKLNTSFHN